MAKIPVVFTFDNRIILAAAISIQSLIDNAAKDTEYDIHVLHDGLSKKNIDGLSKIVKDTRHSLMFHYVDKAIFKGVKKSKNSWTEIVYYRIYIPEILKDYDKVIYSDVDVCFCGDLTEVYNTYLADYEWGGVRAEVNSPEVTGCKYFPENKNKYIFWTGFMLINCKKLRQENYFPKFLKTARDFKDRVSLYDLDVINITCDNILPLSLKYCLLEAFYEFSDFRTCKDYRYLKDVYSDDEIADAIKHPVIIHYAGELGKPWRRKNVPQYYKDYIAEMPKETRKYPFRDLRKKLFSKI